MKDVIKFGYEQNKGYEIIFFDDKKIHFLEYFAFEYLDNKYFQIGYLNSYNLKNGVCKDISKLSRLLTIEHREVKEKVENYLRDSYD